MYRFIIFTILDSSAVCFMSIVLVELIQTTKRDSASEHGQLTLAAAS